jgi:hypothetical protein
MVISWRRTAVPRLCKAVDAYRAEHKANLQNWALELLDRLASSCEAAQAFERLKLKDGCEREFLMLCILVVELARTFPVRILTEPKMPARLKRLEKEITDLRLFVEEQVRQPGLLVPSDMLPIWALRTTLSFPDDFDAVTAMMRGLDLIADVIKKRRRIGETAVAELGATRKKHGENAANIAAIKLLADGTRRLTGKPHKSELTKLAPVILGTELPDESVAYALRAPKRARSRG